MSKVKTWSLSSLSLYEQCPLKYKLQRIDKIPEPRSQALEKGIHYHNVAEQFLLGNITGMPRELAKFATEFKSLKKYNAIPEENWVLDNQWNPVEGEDKWMSKRAWLRAKGDARVDNFIVDFKTGRKYDKHEEQARLYANILMRIDPSLTEVDVEFWYLNSGEVSQYKYYSADLRKDIEQWESRVSKLFNEQHWFPKENNYCRWCSYQDKCELFNG